MEEYSLGDNDILTNEDAPAIDMDRLRRAMRAHANSVIYRTPEEFAGWAEGSISYTSATSWDYVRGIRTTTGTTITDRTDWHIHADTSYAYEDYENEKIQHKEIKTKEEVFILVVNILKSMMFESRGYLLQRIRNMLNNNKKEIEKHFDDCLFICDSRNNKTHNHHTHMVDVEEGIAIDFYFTEKIEKVRRTYRFVMVPGKNDNSDISVFERFLDSKNVSNKNKERVGAKS